MNFAIIAAGEGSRLAAEGVQLPKPLVRLNGVPMIERLINIFVSNNAESISVIVNSENRQTQNYLLEKKEKLTIPLSIIVKTTIGSMHSLYELKPYLKSSPFCLTTVDTVFCEREFKKYIETFTNNSNIDGLMAVTDFIDDEKPLFIQLVQENTIAAFSDTRLSNTHYVSGGIYCLKPIALDILERAMNKGVTRMRDFQRQLLTEGLNVKAFPFKKIIDVDHAQDICKAEQLLNETS